MRCVPGDLAWVIDAHLPENIGRIVKVLRPADPANWPFLRGPAPYWEIEVPRGSRGVALRNLIVKADGIQVAHPDAWLLPIRGNQPMSATVTTEKEPA